MATEQGLEQLSAGPSLFARKLGQGVSGFSSFVLLLDRSSKGDDPGPEDLASSNLLGRSLTRPLVGKESGARTHYRNSGMLGYWNNGVKSESIPKIFDFIGLHRK